jgi:hypothetical protein
VGCRTHTTEFEECVWSADVEPWDETEFVVAVDTDAQDDHGAFVADTREAVAFWERTAQEHLGHPVNFRVEPNASDPDVVVSVVADVEDCGTEEHVAGCAPLADDLDRFRTLVDVAGDRDVTLTVETHWGTHTEDPAVAAEYAASVPGLGYTLDPGHFVVGDHSLDRAMADLLADVAHVHLRQAGAGWAEIQLPVDEGRIDVASVVESLRDSGYDRALTVEYIDSLDGVDSDAAERQADAFRIALEALV